MKATAAQFVYGTSTYPVHEANLPDLPLDLEVAVKEVVRQMSVLSGGHRLEAPEVVLIVAGSGYSVTFMSDGYSKEERPTKHEFDGGQTCSCGQDTVTCQITGHLVCGNLTKWIDRLGNVCLEHADSQHPDTILARVTDPRFQR